MRISDWSSDVCSSDLHALSLARAHVADMGIVVLIAFHIGVAPGVADQRCRDAHRAARVEDVQYRPLIGRSEEHTSELQSLMRISYAVFCLKKKTKHNVTQQDVDYISHIQ